MVNKIWGIFIITGILFCLTTGNIDKVNNEVLSSGKDSLELILKLFPVIALWLGIMKIAVSSGLLKKLSNLLKPLLKFLFPEIPNNHESLDYISSNIITNMFGLGNAATPFGLKAMKSLQQLNNKKDTATRSMITFLVINTSGVTIIPTTIISMRLMHKSINPTCILIPCIISTSLATIGGIIIDRVLARRYKYK